MLHSPLLSGIRVLSPGLRWWPAFADVYPNHLMAPKIQSPTLIMHVSEGTWVCRKWPECFWKDHLRPCLAI